MSSQTSPRRLRITDIQAAKDDGRAITMLTSYDSLTAPIFERAGIDMLLVGDSMGNVMLGYPGTLKVTAADIERAVGAVARSTTRPLIVADLPFGTYEVDMVRAFDTSADLIRAGGHAVKLEGGAPMAPLVRELVSNGIPVMGHLGYTPQSEHALGGPRIQGRGAAGKALLHDAVALADAGAFALVLEMVPANLARQVTNELQIPTIGIGAGPDCSGQVLVWADMAGMTEWTPSFVHRFGELGRELESSASRYVSAVQDGTFPGEGNYRAE